MCCYMYAYFIIYFFYSGKNKRKKPKYDGPFTPIDSTSNFVITLIRSYTSIGLRIIVMTCTNYYLLAALNAMHHYAFVAFSKRLSRIASVFNSVNNIKPKVFPERIHLK